MTNEEALDELNVIYERLSHPEDCEQGVYSFRDGDYLEALDLAIKALETTCIEDYPTCTECEHYDSEKHYCPRFCQVIKDTLAEAQPCEDCISRAKALNTLRTSFLGMSFERYKKAKRMFEQLPSVTPQRPKGKWILANNGWMTICNCCKQGEWKGYVPTPDEATKWMPICPKCGAKMEEE